VEVGFKDVPGVENFSISLLSERATVEHDATRLTVQQIVNIIENRGFGATILDSQKSIPAYNMQRSGEDPPGQQVANTTVAIEGMTCGSCTSAVEGGFKKFSISLLAERAALIHNPTVLPMEKIVQIIEDRGFDARILSTRIGPLEQASSTTQCAQLNVFGVNNAD
jgi:P-type Cu+ transporter